MSISQFPATSEQQEESRKSIREGFINNAAGIWMTLAFSVSYFVLVSELIHEKECKLRESMKVCQ
jgi:hypothetical protein